MTAIVEFQQSLFEEPFSPVEMRSANLIAAYLPDKATLALERTPGGVGLKVTLRIEAALEVREMPLGDEHDIGTELAGQLGDATRRLGKKLP